MFQFVLNNRLLQKNEALKELKKIKNDNYN